MKTKTKKYAPNKALSTEELRNKIETKLYGKNKKDMDKLKDIIKNKLTKSI